MRYPLSLLLALMACLLHAQDLDVFGGGGDLDEFQLDEEPVQDFELLRMSHFSELARWPHTAVVHKSWRKEGQEFHWEQVFVPSQGERLFVAPMSEHPLVNKMEVPEAGSYRIWLSYMAETKKAHPATLTLTGANQASHTFGATQLPNEPAATITRQLPLRFDSEIGKMAAQIKPVPVWEYWDLELKPGTTTLTISSDDREARLDALFITRSKSFVPSKSPVENESNLNHAWYRYRYIDPPGEQVTQVRFSSFVRYVWAHYKPGSTQQLWYSSMGKILNEAGGHDVPVAEWSGWVEVSQQVTSGGKYMTDTLTVTDPAGNEIPTGTVEVQFAWFPHEGGILKTIANPLHEAKTVYLVPVALPSGYASAVSEADAEAGVWGARDADYVGRFLTERGAVERLMVDLEREVDFGEEGSVLPSRLRLFTTCRTSPSAYDIAIPLLKRLGINWVPHLSLADKQRFGLHLEDSIYEQSGTIAAYSHDPLDPHYDDALLDKRYGTEALANKIAADPDYLQRPHWLKMGDEIGKVTSPTHINGLPDCRRAWLDYIRAAAEAAGSDASYFGAATFEDLWYDIETGAEMTLPERRLYYHNMRFIWWLTAEFYKRHSDTARTFMPNLITRCNYTPGGPMFAGTMDYSNWFALPRYQASTGHSSEDWLSAGSGYTSQAGVQTESYYAALVACGARKYNQPMDFIMVGRSGALDRKLPILVGGGIYQVYVYDWGPEYTRGAVDTWSHVFRVYAELNRGARAVGPAEDLLLDGTPDPARIAILYNRTHEIWHAGNYGVFSDRLYTWLALRHSHFPVDIILEEDITPELMAQYRVLYASGFNIERRCIEPLRAWVEGGGTLVAATGFAMHDEYGEPMPEAADLLGATQRFAGVSEGERWMPFYISGHEPFDTITVQASALTEAVEAAVVGLQSVLTPTTGNPIATYADGGVAAVHRPLGQGQVLTYGIMPGLLYANNAPRDDEGRPTTYTLDRRQLVALPAMRTLPIPDATYTEPLSEIYLRRHDDGLAVILVDFSYAPGRPATLSVKTDRQVTAVAGTLSGELTWRRNGDRIDIDLPVPDPSDVIVIR